MKHTSVSAVAVQPNDDESRLMNKREAAAFLGFSTFFVEDHMRRCEPKLPFISIGSRAVRFQRRDLIAFVETLKAKKS
jgi:predicted DNA-binding transcriptional regulator AlpA